MNKDQLERMRKKVEEMATILKEDVEGCADVQEKLDGLASAVTRELQFKVWDEYEKRRQESA